MRILVVSDSHGNFYRFQKVVTLHPEADKIFFLGDGFRDFSDIADLFRDRIFYAVRGNCDFTSPFPSWNTTITCQGKILYTHGDAFGVKGGTERLFDAGRQAGARLVLFGHTHRPCARYEDGLYLFNPGSLAEGSYGICDLLDSGILMNHLTVK